VSPDVPVHYVLGSLCARGHDWYGTGQSLRKRSNGGCRACQDALVRGDVATRGLQSRRRRRGQRPASRLQTPEAEAATHERPALPGHLRSTCFLSPIGCQNAAHRYLDSGYTLRFLDSELCVQCVGQRTSLNGTRRS
jgi:hypothetical protein